MSAANASHPFSIPFSVFLPRLPMFMYVRLITESEDMRLFVSYTRRRQWRSRGSRLNTLVSQGLPPLFSSSPSPLLISSPARSYTRASPMPRASCIPGGERDLLRLIPILETLPLRGRSIAPSHVLPSSFSLLEPLSPFFACLRITGLISILLSSFARSGSRLGISGENELFLYSEANKSPQGRLLQ